MEQGRPHTAVSRPTAAVPEQATPGVPGVRGEHTHDDSQRYARRAPQRYSVRGQVLDALRRALVSGELVPGEVYSGPALGERFGVSATPVREAMQQLALEGAVEVVPNRGFRVASRTPRDLADLAEVRALLEVPVLLRLARTVPACRWNELRPQAETAAAVAAGGDRAAYAEADRAFHRALLELSGNRQLVAVAGEVQRRAQWSVGGDPVADAGQHFVLLDALVAGDLAAVEAVASRHCGFSPPPRPFP
ncbi:GntR family transcriptional regulator [Streptomyces sp. NPDC053048]|uniref:GntR family transcriptional regulator n=1 Tax=Streptomyces sp. NPDC053048 TaxID=3365694 RepID=UPI0037D58F19